LLHSKGKIEVKDPASISQDIQLLQIEIEALSESEEKLVSSALKNLQVAQSLADIRIRPFSRGKGHSALRRNWRPTLSFTTVDNFVDGQSLKGQQLSTGFHKPMITP
jgi:hypothetical protein